MLFNRWRNKFSVTDIINFNQNYLSNNLFIDYFSGIYEVPTDVSKSKATGPFTEPVSAILAPSSITHRTSPQLNLRPRELDPSSHDTGKDTQLLVEEDKSEC